MRQVEWSAWWLSWSDVAITLLLIAGIASFALSMPDRNGQKLRRPAVLAAAKHSVYERTVVSSNQRP